MEQRECASTICLSIVHIFIPVHSPSHRQFGELGAVGGRSQTVGNCHARRRSNALALLRPFAGVGQRQLLNMIWSPFWGPVNYSPGLDGANDVLVTAYGEVYSTVLVALQLLSDQQQRVFELAPRQFLDHALNEGIRKLFGSVILESNDC